MCCGCVAFTLAFMFLIIGSVWRFSEAGEVCSGLFMKVDQSESTQQFIATCYEATGGCYETSDSNESEHLGLMYWSGSFMKSALVVHWLQFIFSVVLVLIALRSFVN